MKNTYVSPKLELIELLTDEVLGPSGGDVLLNVDQIQSGKPAEEFGDINLF